MEEKVKEILAKFLRLPVSEIYPATIIDRSAVASSIVLHRMYAALAAAGFEVTDYRNIKTFSVLMQKLGGNTAPAVSVTSINIPAFSNEQNQQNAVGIDIEEIALMPKVADFRDDEFYTSNFAITEIAYCILQPDAYASFAGLFAAKEAIVKADNNYLNQQFKTIVIDHLPGGKPVHPHFQVSISHTSSVAIAVAVNNVTVTNSNIAAPLTVQKPASLLPVYILSFLSLILSVILLFAFFKTKFL